MALRVATGKQMHTKYDKTFAISLHDAACRYWNADAYNIRWRGEHLSEFEVI